MCGRILTATGIATRAADSTAGVPHGNRRPLLIALRSPVQTISGTFRNRRTGSHPDHLVSNRTKRPDTKKEESRDAKTQKPQAQSCIIPDAAQDDGRPMYRTYIHT